MLVAWCAVMALSPSQPGAAIPLTNGQVIRSSAAITPREYLFPAVQGTKRAGDEVIPTFKPAIIIRGNNLTIDFGGAILRGTPETIDPELRQGLGVLVEGTNITIKNLHVHGYKVGLAGNGCKGLRILNSDFSYNWKQRLYSTPEKEDERDWQSYHHNEHNEWLRYGAGIYLEHCSDFLVQANTITGGQCGLMLVDCRHGKVNENNFSFLSGVGLGMYRSSANSVTLNRMDWCVRGFSYGIYNRGQDSAGILVFEGCHLNVFAYNSVTHGGDGFFLWAGQTMMDTGQGGCNGNLLFGNDFSHSPCNGIEATFSSNTFVNNKLVECWHGVWGGYSFNTKIAGNLFAYNGEAIAIEHGQDNSISYNLFYRENTAIDLWQDPIHDAHWAYPKHHDTVSHDYQIASNVFDGSTGSAIAVRDTLRVKLGGNLFKNCQSALKESGTTTGSVFDLSNVLPGDPPAATMSTSGRPEPGTSNRILDYVQRFDLPWEPFADPHRLLALKRPLTFQEQRVVDSGVSVPLPSHPINPFLLKGLLRGQRYILVDEWGPYDFRRPIVVPRETLPGAPNGFTQRRFEILGPLGRWKLVGKKGTNRVSKEDGSVPGFVDVEIPSSETSQVSLQFEYEGMPTTDQRGVVTPAKTPVRFGWVAKP